MRISTLPGAFSPHPDSWLLVEAIESEGPLHGRRALDLCTGSGVAAVALARAGAQVTAVDTSRRVVVCTRRNARRNRVQVEARTGSLFEPVPARQFDVITANPPYVPSDDDGTIRRGRGRAWRAGPDGRVVLDRLIEQLPAYLRPGGRVMVVHSTLIDDRATVADLEAIGLANVAVVARRRGPLGPLMQAQQRAGRIDPAVDHEDLVVIRAEAPPPQRIEPVTI